MRIISWLKDIRTYVKSGNWKREIISDSKYPYIIKLGIALLRLTGKATPYYWNGIRQHCINKNIEIKYIGNGCDEKSIMRSAIIDNGKIINAKVDTIHFDDAYYLRLKDVITLSGIGSFIHDGEILSPKSRGYWISLNHTANDAIVRYDEKKCYLLKQTEIKTISRGILLVSRWPKNLCHVIIDVMLRLHTVDVDSEFDNWPILMSELTLQDSRFMAVVKRFNTKNRQIILLNNNQNYRVNDAIIPSFLNMNISKKVWNGALSLSGFLAHDQVMYIRRIWDCNPNAIGTRKIFVFRPCHDRLLNEELVMEYFLHKGFELIDMGSLSFEQQVECFQNTKWMIATHGAALTNVALCPHNAKIVQITAPEIMNNVRFDNLAYKAGCKFFSIEGHVVKKQFNHLAPGLKIELPIERCNQILKILQED